MIDLNATKAAIRAGYKPTTARQMGNLLLTKVDISSHVEQLREKQSKRTDITADMVIAELARIGFHNVKDFVNGGNNVLELKGIDSNKTAAVAGVKTTVNENSGNITTEIKFHDKVSALEKLGRHLGIFERDNAQQKTDSAPPIINVYNSAPPLPSDESDIDV